MSSPANVRLLGMLPEPVLTRLITARVHLRRWRSGAHRGPSPRMMRLAVDGAQTFFGYYDKSPFSPDGTRVLAGVVPRGTYPAAGVEMRIGMFDVADETASFQPVGSTDLWCWQQGARLQWVPGFEGERVMYNAMVDGVYGNVTCDVGTGDVTRSLRQPLYDVSRDGAWGASLNFSRLQRMRAGYGYSVLPDRTRDDLCPDDDGIFVVDLASGDATLVMSTAELAGLEPAASMVGAEHYVNHLCFNPSADRLMLCHLWIQEDRRHSRIVTIARHGGEACVLTHEGHASHYAWLSDTELLAYATHADTGRGYHVHQDCSSDHRRIAAGALDEDGHPTVSRGGDMILTDTYPDRNADRRLLTYCVGTGQVREVARFFSPPSRRGEFRCDLHPRWDSGENRICVDSDRDGQRCMYILSPPNPEP